MADEKKPKDASTKEPEAVKASGWEDERPKPKWRNFPAANAGASNEPLRVAFNREAYAEISSHAKDSLDKEICGVLVGDLCEDDHGEFIEVTAVIRGTAAKKGATHVTFTQETWNQIHEEKEKSHRKKQILGWYHSHPGFGVDFSEMDLFIQKNFFGGPTQIAFVIDPLGGQEAILANRGGATVPVRKFWVDGRERKAVAPGKDDDAAASSGGGGGGGGVATKEMEKTVRALEDRVNQLVHTVEAQHVLVQRVLMFIFLLAAFGVVYWIATQVWSAFTAKPLPEGFVELIKVPVNGKMMKVGVKVQVMGVDLDPAEQAALFEQVLKAAEEAREKARAATQPSKTTQPAAGGGK